MTRIRASVYDIPIPSSSDDTDRARVSTSTTYQKSSFCKRFRLYFKNHWNGLCAILVPGVIALLMALWKYLSSEMQEVKLCECAGVVLIILYYWLTEPIPAPITALIPIVALPLFEILDPEVVSSCYFSDAGIIIVCGTMASLTIEYCGLHNKLALYLVAICGYRLRLLHFITMMTSWLFSNVCQDVVITALMCPVITALLRILGQEFHLIDIHTDTTKDSDEDERRPSKVSIGFYLGICYSIAIGGTATLLGGESNREVETIYKEYVFPYTNDDNLIDFKHYMFFAIPPSAILLIFTYFILEVRYFGLFRSKRSSKFGIRVVSRRKLILKPLFQKFGKFTSGQICVILLFMLLVVLYMNRTVGLEWIHFFQRDKIPLDSLCTVMVVALYFAIPRDLSFYKYFAPSSTPLPSKEIPSLAKWRYLVRRLPWENFMITGCATAISHAMITTKLFAKMDVIFDSTQHLDKELIIFIFVTLQYLLTQLTENATTCNLFMEALKNRRNRMSYHPLYFAMPVAIVSNMSFMLPVSTPSNLLVASFSHIKLPDFFVSGFLVTMCSYSIVMVTVMYWTQVVYPDLSKGFSTFVGNFPEYHEDNQD